MSVFFEISVMGAQLGAAVVLYKKDHDFTWT